MFGRTVLFGTPVAINALVGIATIPAILSVAGGLIWNSIIVAQGVGGIASVAGAFGWGATGPTMVATSTALGRRQLYAESLVARIYLSLPIIFVLLLGLAISTGLSPVTVIAALSAYVPGLSATWYFTGESKPMRLLMLDTLPKTTSTAVGLLTMLAFENVLLLVALQLLGALVAVVLSAFMILRRTFDTNSSRIEVAWHPATIWLTLRTQLAGVTTTLTSSLYVNAPPILANAFGPAVAIPFNLGYKLFRYVLMGLLPLNQVMQGWVPSNKRLVEPRVRLGARVTFAAAAFAGIMSWIIMPPLGSWMSAAKIELEYGMAGFFGLGIFSVVLSQYTGLTVLMMMRLRKQVALSTLLGAAVGLPGIVVGGTYFGASGAAAALGVAETAVLGAQILWILRYRKPVSGTKGGSS